ncbi:hypothetical protein ACPWT1_18500 [Ramlibacter sp. MMS24-I3-19]|uniref:hypothetical protein n=1 Tax=Ramlibacter sp. MMS24-I3-19 TaxID=3416606 RepID=UPI003D084C88
MNTRKSGLALAVAASVALLVACGGGGGGGGTPVVGGGGGDVTTGGGGGGGGGQPSTTAVAVTVIDGAIRNATVCLDKNLNGACDSDEPSAKTDASGAASLQVDAADAGKYPVLAIVGTDAVDADNGAVTTAFVLKAPADKPAVVSPLTTLVQSQVEATGASTATAEAAIKAQIGLDVSLFQDFTKSTTTEGATLNAIARTIVVTTQQQTSALASSVGGAAIDGSTITQQDINDLITRKLLEVLPSVVAQLADPAVQAAIASKDPAQLNAALAPVVASAVSSSGITTSSVGTLVGIANQQQAATGEVPVTNVATAALNQLTYNGAGNWFQRVFSSTAAQNAPDASGNTRAVERRSRANSGVVAHWAFGGNPSAQSDFHWNGGNWVQCALQTETISGVRDAEGRANYNYCDGFDVGSSQRAAFDVSGKTMLDVYNQVRGAGFVNITIANAATALGTATFPANSKLFYQTNTPLSTAIGYSPSPASELRNLNADVAAGNASASDTGAACASITPATSLTTISSPATSLESFIAANPATPCYYPTSTMQVPSTSGTPVTVSSGSRNEWWNNSTAGIGQLGNVPVGAVQTAGSESYYTGNTLLRVGFAAGNVAKYFACQQRASDGSVRNCNPIGTGTYAINTLGDARVLTLANTPVQAAALQERVFVERGGKVRVGYKNRTTPNPSARMNMAATNALLAQLGMEAVDPEAAFELTPASYQGDWQVWNAADVDVVDYSIVRIQPNFNGTTGYLCFDNTGATFSCTLSLNPATGAVTLQDTDGVLTATFGMASGAVTGSFAPAAGGAAETIVGRRR